MADPIKQLLALGVLGAISEDELRAVSPPPEFLSVDVGDTITRQGEIGSAYFLLLRGRMRRFVTDRSGLERRVDELYPGEGVGASSILTGNAHDTSSRAMQACDLIRFPRASFLQLMVLSWEFSIGVTRTQIKRARAATKQGAHHLGHRSVALVPISSSVNCAAFANSLSDAMSGIASAMVCDAATMVPFELTSHDTPDSKKSKDRDSLISHLDYIERQNDVVLYVTSHEPDDWAQLTIARANTVFFLASIDDASDQSEIEAKLIAPIPHELLPRTHLALLHGRDWKRSPKTAKWLSKRKIDEWHHVRENAREDFEKLARILTGNAVSVVFGGGGARSFTQIGAVRAIREAGIPIDRIAGTSMGAIVGGYVALGMSNKDIAADFLKRWKDSRAGRDFTFPAMSLLHCKGLHDAAIEVFGALQIEDLTTSFFCISSDLSSNAMVLHDRGPMWKAVRASASLPGISPPLFDGGRVLVDGALLNNLPCDIMAERYSGRIVAIDVSEPGGMTVPMDFEEVPSGWKILWHKINPFLNPISVPSIFNILTRSTTLASTKTDENSRTIADLLLTPPVTNVGITEFHRLEELVETGYQYTAEELRKVDLGIL